MKKNKLLNDKLFITILSLYIIGIFIGIFVNIKKDLLISYSNKNFFKIFSLNYWYLLLMWIMGLSAIGIIFNPFMIAFRGFLYGGMVVALIQISFRQFFITTILDLVIMVPSLFALGYCSIRSSQNNLASLFNDRMSNLNTKFYIDLMLFITLAVLIYSIILSIN